VSALSPSVSYFTISVVAKARDDGPVSEVWAGYKLCLVTIDTRASMTIAMSGITVRVPKRKPSWLYLLQMGLGETLHFEKSAGRGDPGPVASVSLGTSLRDHG
jgi:hypothetical protein